jgi:Na+-translocating ferredoxin:NAD+ oxidoreductase RnfC subunit
MPARERRHQARQVILGGPMMGQSVASLDVPVTKGVSGVLVFRGEDMADREGRKSPIPASSAASASSPARWA